jgi:uncharacterized protein (DUF885 family)
LPCALVALLCLSSTPLLLAACAGPDSARRTAPASTAGARLHALFDREWQWRLQRWPEFATAAGVHDRDDQLADLSLEALEEQDRESRAFLAEAQAIEALGPRALEEEERIDLTIFRTQLEDRIAAHSFGEDLLTLNADSGYHSEFPLIWQAMPFQTERQYQNYLARLRAFPRAMEQNTALLREGIRRGITVPRATLTGADAAARALVVEPEQSALFTPFTRLPAQLPEAVRARLLAEGRKVLAESVLPAFAKFASFLAEEYLPKARTTLAASDLPDGAAYYRFLIKRYTTRDLSADQVHQLGLAQVKALRAEMEAVIQRIGFKGDFAAFLAFLRTDPRFYARTPEELLMRAAWIAKQMDGKLPSLFKTLPRQPYTVAKVPDYLAPKYTGGRYNGAPIDSTEPGVYWVNTHALETRPFYNQEALTFHEAVPGHHLQGALAQEARAVPEFRRHSYISAFGEGWGLYAEWLGKEAGFYTDPYSEFGRLTYAMWRACRLVVDTGVHARGWTRDQVMELLAANTALSLHEVETETDRYISWPGQALSYQIGYLAIRELRARAEAALGERFDLRLFHDAVLKNGSLPLPLLEAQVERFISEQRQAAPAR